MSEAAYEHQILSELQTLPMGEQKEVLDFVRYLKFKKEQGVSGKVLLPFAGTISATDLELMSKAIEEGCEQIYAEEW